MALLFGLDHLLSNKNCDKEDIDISFDLCQLSFSISNLEILV